MSCLKYAPLNDAHGGQDNSNFPTTRQLSQCLGYLPPGAAYWGTLPVTRDRLASLSSSCVKYHFKMASEAWLIVKFAMAAIVFRLFLDGIILPI